MLRALYAIVLETVNYFSARWRRAYGGSQLLPCRQHAARRPAGAGRHFTIGRRGRGGARRLASGTLPGPKIATLLRQVAASPRQGSLQERTPAGAAVPAGDGGRALGDALERWTGVQTDVRTFAHSQNLDIYVIL